MATATAIASRRTAIGVVPACAMVPAHSTRNQRTAWMPVTTPSGTAAASSTGPCSIWSSTQADIGRAIGTRSTSGLAASAASSASPNRTPA
ncbi:hypothetical protein D3C81_1865200 [compost metagenome]